MDWPSERISQSNHSMTPTIKGTVRDSYAEIVRGVYNPSTHEVKRPSTEWISDMAHTATIVMVTILSVGLGVLILASLN